MSDLIPFAYGEQPVRVIPIDGEPWFVLGDICKVLGMARGAAQVAERLDDGVRQTYPLPTAGGVQRAILVSEPGMYEVVIRSDKPEAAAFRRWITTEVLPSIRKTGSYSTVPALPQTMGEALRLAADEFERAEREAAARREAEAHALALEAPAAAWHVMAESAGDYGVGDAAKVLSRDPSIEIGRTRLFTFMQAEGWLFRTKGRRPGWSAYQVQVDNGRLVERLGAAFQNAKTGEMELPAPTIRITAKGLAELHKRLGGTGAVPVLAEVSA